jgi:hypothetical protein
MPLLQNFLENIYNFLPIDSNLMSEYIIKQIIIFIVINVFILLIQILIMKSKIKETLYITIPILLINKILILPILNDIVFITHVSLMYVIAFMIISTLLDMESFKLYMNDYKKLCKFYQIISIILQILIIIILITQPILNLLTIIGIALYLTPLIIDICNFKSNFKNTFKLNIYKYSYQYLVIIILILVSKIIDPIHFI